MDNELHAGVGRAFFGDFASLRSVQAKAIPSILSGADALVRAPTASGKTEAAIAPLVSRLLDQLQRPDSGVGIIVVSPTRALVNDLHRRLQSPLEQLGVRCGVRHGERNHLHLAEPPAVLLTTPESFDIEVGRQPSAFEQVRAVVLDEAHLLYNTQRGMQVAIGIQRLQTWLGRDLQVVGLSATIGSTADVWRFFRPGHEVEDITDEGGRGLAAQLRLDVSISELAGLLQRVDDKKVLVFANSRRDCDQIVDQLERSRLRCPVFAHHSSLSREAREATEAGFEAAMAAVCVATSTLELGIDIGSIDLVVLYGIPADWQSLAQRVGRGNRRSESIEAMLCTSSDRGQPDSVSQLLGFQALLLQMREPAITNERPRTIFGAVGQQLASWLVAGERFRGVNTLTEPMAIWPHLDPTTVTAILDELAEFDVLKRHSAYRQYGPSDGAYELERTWDLWSNFVGAGRQANVSASGNLVGRISARDAERLTRGDCFLLGGRRWRVVSKSMFDVDVQSAKAAPNIELRYGSGAPVEGPLHAEAIRRALLSPVDQYCEIRPATSREHLISTVEQLAPLAADEVIPTARDSSGRHLYLTFAGALVNDGIARTIGDATAKAGQFVLESGTAVDWSVLPTAFSELPIRSELPPRSSRTRFQEWLPSELARREQRSADLAPYGHDVVLHRLRRAVERPTPIDLIDRFRT
jgi:ATP-dependent Lhr-like helicase